MQPAPSDAPEPRPERQRPTTTTVALTLPPTPAWLAATNGPVFSLDDHENFRDLLRKSGPVLAVVCVPPATPFDIEATAAVRRARRDVRAMLIDAPSDSPERLAALREGFDQAVDTRFDAFELASRVQLLVDELAGMVVPRRIELGPRVWLDGDRRELVVDGRPVHLRPREYALLDILAREPGRTFSRQELLELVGAQMGRADLRSVDVHVTWLREKLERAGQRGPILAAVRGVGYRLENGSSEITTGAGTPLTKR